MGYVKEIWVAIRDSQYLIETVDTIEEGEKLIDKLEIEDDEIGEYVSNTYCIAIIRKE